jgi:cell wall-associated NlpC family hydrolase
MISLSNILLLYIGIPYVWGGNNPTIGLDCSGLVCEGLRSIGVIGKADYNAQMLYDHLKEKSYLSKIAPDSIIFFGKDTKNISHIAVAINKFQMVEAGGEGRIDTDKGYVRIRPIHSRKDLVATINL